MSDVTDYRAKNGRFLPGNNGNPKGRPKVAFELAARCREFAPKILNMLVEDLDAEDWKTRHSAAGVLLDRGFGKPRQDLTVTGDGPGALHLLAAQMVSAAIIEALGDAPKPPPPQIDATPLDVLDSPKPTE